jgi:hypothetical protein
MKIIKDKISIDELKVMAQKMYGRIVKAVVDVEQQIMAVDVAMHVDAEAELLENGSEQENLWGINIDPNKTKQEWVEFDSMINIRPWQENRTRGVENPALQKKIISIVHRLVSE